MGRLHEPKNQFGKRIGISTMTFKEWLLQGTIAFDQLCNWFCWGYADETLSARAYRLSSDRQRHWPKKIIDTFFRLVFAQQTHCEDAFTSEHLRKHLPRQYSK